MKIWDWFKIIEIPKQIKKVQVTEKRQKNPAAFYGDINVLVRIIIWMR